LKEAMMEAIKESRSEGDIRRNEGSQKAAMNNMSCEESNEGENEVI
jgi:hypothetical protein